MYAELEDNFSTQVADLYMDEALNKLNLISKKYGLAKWQWDALLRIIKDAFLKQIILIKIPIIIKDDLNIKDKKIAKSVSLDLAIHLFSLDKDHFKEADNLIKSLGGEEAYWKKYNQYPSYWDEIIVAETLPTPNDIEVKWKERKETERKEWEDAAKRREKEEAERREREEAERRERNKLEKKRHSKKIIIGIILCFVAFEVLTRFRCKKS